MQLEKVESALKAHDIDLMIEVIDESVKAETLEDLRNFMDSQSEFTSKNEFEIVLKSLFYISKYDLENKYNTLFQIKNLLRNKSIPEELYSDNRNEYSTFLLTILQDSKYEFEDINGILATADSLPSCDFRVHFIVFVCQVEIICVLVSSVKFELSKGKNEAS